MKIRNWAAVAAKFRVSGGPMRSRNKKRDKEPTDWLLVDDDGFELEEQERKEKENEEYQEEGGEGDCGDWGDGSDSVG